MLEDLMTLFSTFSTCGSEPFALWMIQIILLVKVKVICSEVIYR